MPMPNYGGMQMQQNAQNMATMAAAQVPQQPRSSSWGGWPAQPRTEQSSSSGNESDQHPDPVPQSSDNLLLELEARVKLAEERAKNAEELAVYSEQRAEQAVKSHENLLRQQSEKKTLGTIEGPVTDATSCSEGATSGPGQTDDECKLEFQAMEKAVLDIVSEENTPPGLSDNVVRKIDRKT